MRFLIFSVEKSFLTKNYLLIAVINLTSWDPLYTCLVLSWRMQSALSKPFILFSLSTGTQETRLWCCMWYLVFGCPHVHHALRVRMHFCQVFIYHQLSLGLQSSLFNLSAASPCNFLKCWKFSTPPNYC